MWGGGVDVTYIEERCVDDETTQGWIKKTQEKIVNDNNENIVQNHIHVFYATSFCS